MEHHTWVSLYFVSSSVAHYMNSTEVWWALTGTIIMWMEHQARAHLLASVWVFFLLSSETVCLSLDSNSTLSLGGVSVSIHTARFSSRRHHFIRYNKRESMKGNTGVFTKWTKYTPAPPYRHQPSPDDCWELSHMWHNDAPVSNNVRHWLCHRQECQAMPCCAHTPGE